MRHRTFDKRSLTARSLYQISRYRTSAPAYRKINSIARYTGFRKTMDDTVTPGWNKLGKEMALGYEVILNPVTLTVVNRTGGGSTDHTFQNRNGTVEIIGDLAAELESWSQGTINNDPGLLTRLTSGELERMKSVALVKAYAKAKSMGTLMGENLAELSQTIQTLRHPFNGVTKLVRKMIKFRNHRHMLNKVRTAKTFARANADAWLEYRYGWKPLLLDCDEIITAAVERRERCLEKFLVSRASGGRVTYEQSKHRSMPDQSAMGSLGVSSAAWNCCLQEEAAVTAGVMFRRKARTTSQMLTATLGLRPSDLPSTAWELLPHSFVVDWFTNVGDWIRAVTPDPDLVLIGNWVTTCSSSMLSQSDGKLTVFTYGAPMWPDCHVPSSTTHTKVYRRQVNYPLASSPVWTKKPLSMLHLTDAMALSCGKITSLLGSLAH